MLLNSSLIKNKSSSPQNSICLRGHYLSNLPIDIKAGQATFNRMLFLSSFKTDNTLKYILFVYYLRGISTPRMAFLCVGVTVSHPDSQINASACILKPLREISAFADHLKLPVL